MPQPAVGERVTVTLHVPGGPPIETTGTVVYIYPSQGFGVAFTPDDAASAALHAAELRAGAKP